MKSIKKLILIFTWVLGVCLASPMAQAQVDLEGVKNTINENWSKNIPTFPTVTEVRTTPISGLYEVVIGGEVVYTDRQGNYLLMGELMDLKGQRNLTQERLKSLVAVIDFDKLPFENAIVIKRGNGERKLVVFEDPNCSFCHKFERELMAVDNVTIYIFLYPILSNDSRTVATSIWCAQNPAKAWEDWMVRETKPTPTTCDQADAVLNANINVGRGYGINGTPTLVFTDGSRIPGAVGPEDVEAQFKEIAEQ
ncbi:MAG: DsbC family protein [Saezia sp.]